MSLIRYRWMTKQTFCIQLEFETKSKAKYIWQTQANFTGLTRFVWSQGLILHFLIILNFCGCHGNNEYKLWVFVHRDGVSLDNFLLLVPRKTRKYSDWPLFSSWQAYWNTPELNICFSIPSITLICLRTDFHLSTACFLDFSFDSRLFFYFLGSVCQHIIKCYKTFFSLIKFHYYIDVFTHRHINMTS